MLKFENGMLNMLVLHDYDHRPTFIAIITP